MTGLVLEHLTYNLENFCAHATQLALTIIMNIAKLGTGGGAASRRKPSNVVFFPTIITTQWKRGGGRDEGMWTSHYIWRAWATNAFWGPRPVACMRSDNSDAKRSAKNSRLVYVWDWEVFY